MHASEEAMKSLRIAEELQKRTKDEMDRCAAAEKLLRDVSKEVKVKDAMLEDQNDSIRKLKQSIATMQEEHSIAEDGLREALQDVQVT